MINKRQNRILGDKKLLHKKGKRWITVSVAMLGALGTGALATHTANAAHVNTNQPTTHINAASHTAVQSANTNSASAQSAKANVNSTSAKTAPSVSQQSGSQQNGPKIAFANSVNPSANGRTSSASLSTLKLLGGSSNANNAKTSSVGTMPAVETGKTMTPNMPTTKNTPADELAPQGAQQVAQGNWGNATWNFYKNGQLDIHDGDMKTNATPSGFNPQKVYSIKTYNVSAPINMNYLFAGHKVEPFPTNASGNFWNVQNIDLSGMNTSNTTSMAGLFHTDGYLNNIKFGHTFNTSHVTDMRAMFDDDVHIKSLDMSSFNTQNVNSFSMMFWDMPSLKSLDVSNFRIKNGADLSNMFAISANSWTRTGTSYTTGPNAQLAQIVLNNDFKNINTSGYTWHNPSNGATLNNKGVGDAITLYNPDTHQTVTNWSQTVQAPGNWIDKDDMQNYNVKFLDEVSNAQKGSTTYYGIHNAPFLPINGINLPNGYRLAPNAGTTANVVNGNTATIKVIPNNASALGVWGNANWILYNNGNLELLNGALETNQVPDDLAANADKVTSISTTNVTAPGDASNLFNDFYNDTHDDLTGFNSINSSNRSNLLGGSTRSVTLGNNARLGDGLLAYTSNPNQLTNIGDGNAHAGNWIINYSATSNSNASSAANSAASSAGSSAASSAGSAINSLSNSVSNSAKNASIAASKSASSAASSAGSAINSLNTSFSNSISNANKASSAYNSSIASSDAKSAANSAANSAAGSIAAASASASNSVKNAENSLNNSIAAQSRADSNARQNDSNNAANARAANSAAASASASNAEKNADNHANAINNATNNVVNHNSANASASASNAQKNAENYASNGISNLSNNTSNSFNSANNSMNNLSNSANTAKNSLDNHINTNSANATNYTNNKAQSLATSEHNDANSLSTRVYSDATSLNGHLAKNTASLSNDVTSLSAADSAALSYSDHEMTNAIMMTNATLNKEISQGNAQEKSDRQTLMNKLNADYNNFINDSKTKATWTAVHADESRINHDEGIIGTKADKAAVQKAEQSLNYSLAMKANATDLSNAVSKLTNDEANNKSEVTKDIQNVKEIAGRNGRNGTNGTNGSNGVNGHNGSRGDNGMSGRNGANGMNGAAGKAGRDAEHENTIANHYIDGKAKLVNHDTTRVYYRKDGRTHYVTVKAGARYTVREVRGRNGAVRYALRTNGHTYYVTKNNVLVQKALAKRAAAKRAATKDMRIARRTTNRYVPGYVVAKRSARLYYRRGGRNHYIVITPRMKYTMKVVSAKHGKYTVKIGRRYFKVNKRFVQNAYYHKYSWKRSHKAHVFSNCLEYSTPRYTRRTAVRVLRKGKTLHIKREVRSGRLVRFQLRNGRYVTADRNFVRVVR